jgi:NAD(P)-dependent dehydrogenase (short-subunit alcohol dehydrogenase family)
LAEPIRGKEVLLAGGSGGLGSAVVELLTAEGARLVVSNHSNRARAERLGGSAQIVPADLTLDVDRHRLLDAAPQLYGLVVFAGDPARLPAGANSRESRETMQRSHDVNYLGPILIAREAAERMKASGTPGAIVLMATMQAIALFPGSTAYAAQKAALVHGALILAKECRGPVNIRVNVVSPGVTNTGMAQASVASGKYDRYLKEGIVARFGRGEDIARAVRFFLEPDNYVTGQVLSVDGGITL